MSENVVHSAHGRHCGMEIEMKTTRLLVTFFVLFGSAITLSHGGNQLVSAAAPIASPRLLQSLSAALSGKIGRDLQLNRLKINHSGKIAVRLNWSRFIRL
jgi:hypothetical protein